MKYLILTLLIGGFFSLSKSTPPYMWYGTYSIEWYPGNGGSTAGRLTTPHEDALGFHTAIMAPEHANIISNESYQNNRKDTEVTAARFSGPSAETNMVDFLFYAGHGSPWGPYLGDGPIYTITSTDIKFGGNYYLKWVQAAACSWFAHEDLANGETPFQRWGSSFQGVHTVQGHRALTYDHSNYMEVGDGFWDRWVIEGSSIYHAWKNSQIEWIYTKGGKPGLQPATMAPNSSYGYETFSSAVDSPAPNGAGWLSWATVGNPQY